MQFRGRSFILPLALLGCVTSPSASAADDPASQNAKRFGMLESIRDVSLSPDGRRIAFIENGPLLLRRLFVVDVADGATPKQILSSDGSNGFLSWCGWVTHARLVCQTYQRDRRAGEIIAASNIIGIDAAGGNLKLLSNRRSARSLYVDRRGGEVIDWSPSDTGSVLMTRTYVPEIGTGTNIVQRAEGMGVDRVDVVTGASSRIEGANRDATGFLSDGHGEVRIMETHKYSESGQFKPEIMFQYRTKGSSVWKHLSNYDVATEKGFYPLAIDPATDRVFGVGQVDGRKAIMTIALDGSSTSALVFARPDVDVENVIRIGRNGRIVGVSYVTDKREAAMTDPAIAKLTTALSSALGGRQVSIVDASSDESVYLVRTSADTDPGQYFLFDKKTKELRPLLGKRDALADVALSPMRSITYPAADGTMVPGYLTLPPGREDARGLPAIVMPHGGPSARDEWGFDWLVQFLAQSGYAVLQPNFRGSSGYGEAWFLKNGFQSWKAAMSDIADAGKWLVASQGADAARLSIVGWSYGGYAALQSGVAAPGLFKSIVAIAPVTDLEQLQREEAEDGGGTINARFVGTGAHIKEGSPAKNADLIVAPVLMFHGTFDQSVRVEQGRTMQRALQSKGKRVELVEYPEIGHNLETAEARTDMLSRIAAFLPR